MMDVIHDLQKEIQEIGDKIISEKLKIKGANYNEIRGLQQLLDDKIEELNICVLDVRGAEEF